MVAALTLAACGQLPKGEFSNPLPDIEATLAEIPNPFAKIENPFTQKHKGPMPTRLSVMGGDVLVTGPEGFCIDVKGSRETQGNAFALMGSCAAITHRPDAPEPARPAVLTATVMTAGDAPLAESFPQMAAFFASDAGRAALARSGRARDLTIRRAFSRGDVFVIAARDTSRFEGPKVEPDYWRALFDLDGHIVSASVLALRGKPIPDAAAESLLDDFVGRIRAANRQ